MIPRAELEFSAAMRDSPFVTKFVHRPVSESTNDDAHALAAANAPEGTVVVADAQTAGRGRLARVWHSPPGLGLYLSTLHRPRRSAAELPRWTLAAAVAACEACREVARVDAAIKWPNDVLAGGKKLAGILAESRTTGTNVAWLVVGTGFNVNHLAADFPAEFADRATSLRILAAGRSVDRARLARVYIDRLGAWTAELAEGRFDALAEAWQRLAPGARGARVRWTDSSGAHAVATACTGVTLGLDESGALRVEVDGGRVIAVRIGESLTAVEDEWRSSRSM